GGVDAAAAGAGRGAGGVRRGGGGGVRRAEAPRGGRDVRRETRAAAPGESVRVNSFRALLAATRRGARGVTPRAPLRVAAKRFVGVTAAWRRCASTAARGCSG